MTASKFTTKTKATAVVDAVNNDPSPLDDAMRRYSASADELMRNLVPAFTFKRMLASAVIGLVVYASGMYLAIGLVDWIVLGTLSLTGSTFLGFLAMVLSAFMLGFAAAWAGVKAFKFVAEFDLGSVQRTGQELRVAAARRVSLARGWFKRSDAVTA